MSSIAVRPDGYEVGELGHLTRAIVRASYSDEDWREVVDMHDPITLASTLKRVLRDIADQDILRMNGLANARDDEAIDDEDYAVLRRHYRTWKRSAARVKQSVRLRLDEVLPVAQSHIDSAQADRRTLVRLAKRVWLWEQGAEFDGLDDALDELTLSEGNPTNPRRTLREVVEAIANSGEILP